MTTKLMSNFSSMLLSAAVFGVASGGALAQSYPSRPITLVSPFPAGSGSDLTARAIAPAVGEILGQPMVVDNKPGAGGAIGAQFVAKAPPGGYTLLLSSLSFSVLPSLMELNFDPVKDFEAVTMMGLQNMVLVVPASLPVNSISDLVALAKSKPGQLNYTSAGIGSIGHLLAELLKMERGVDMVHIPFKGTPDALREVMTGRAHISFVTMPAAEPQIKAHTVKALGVTGDKRAPEVPDVPTMVEAGFPSLGDSVWYAILAPAGTPKEVVAQLNAAFHKALSQPSTIERLAKSAKTTTTKSTPEEAAAYVKSQVAKWTKVVKDANIRIGGVK